jgi:uncharacterized membrane protein YphA (DoxX/SURF4 family)
MGRVAEEAMTTPNAEHRTPNIELETAPSEFGVGRSALGVRRFSQLILRLLALIIAAIFIYAGVVKVLDPVQFARDIDNYKMLPWSAAVALGLYLPWLEIFCGLALIIRRLYRGAVLLLTGLTIIFIVASVIAKARGLDISCGCFGHVSQGWSFGWHMALDFGLLAALVVLIVTGKTTPRSRRGG